MWLTLIWLVPVVFSAGFFAGALWVAAHADRERQRMCDGELY